MKVFVDKVSDIPAGKMIHIEANGKEIVVANVNGKYYAVSDICNHAGANLHEGSIEGNEITCPWHHAKWDITTGKLIKFPVQLKELERYSISVEGDSIYLDLTP